MNDQFRSCFYKAGCTLKNAWSPLFVLHLWMPLIVQVDDIQREVDEKARPESNPAKWKDETKQQEVYQACQRVRERRLSMFEIGIMLARRRKRALGGRGRLAHGTCRL